MLKIIEKFKTIKFYKITETLWYDKKTDSTLKRTDWRFHHNGISFWLMGIGMYINLFLPNHINNFIIAGFISLIFLIYKLFIQSNIKVKKSKDFKDTFSDFIDYGVPYVIAAYPDKFLIGLIFFIMFILTIFTSIKNWSTP